MSLFPSIKRIAEGHRRDWGEVVTFRGQRITVMINHEPTVSWANGEKDRGNPQFLPEAFSSVRVLNDAVDSQPKPGEVFTDEDGMQHRIQETRTFRLSYLCLCKHTTS